MKIKPKLIYNIAFFSIIFMYFKIIPVNIETQPILVVLLIPLFLLVNNNMILTIKSEEKYLFIYLFIILFYFFISLFANPIDSFLYFIKFILGPISYIFLLKNVELLEAKTLKIMTLILFFVSFIYLTHFPILFNLLNSVLSIFINRYVINYIGVRGINILTPEPSYFVYFAMLLLFSFDFIEYKSKLPEHVFYRILIYFMCILTKSALVYAFLILYLAFKYIFFNSKLNVKTIIRNVSVFGTIFVFVIMCLKVFNIDLANNRFIQVINSIQYQNLISMFFYSDASSGFRFLMNTIYILSIFIRPFGYGLGGMEKEWSKVADFLNINYERNTMFKYSYTNSSLLHAQAYFPNVIGAVGIFSILLVLFVYKNNRLDDIKLKNSLIIILTLFLWILQSNMFNPVFWVLIAFCKFNSEYKENN